MITVGLDFGTHQTKICIEERKGYETHYKFHKFRDLEGRMQYTLPSILCITPEGRLKYGFVGNVDGGIYKRYFKQAVYRDTDSPGMTLWEAARYSIWYLAYLLFDLEDVYGKMFTIQMGAPSDSSGIDDRKAIAVSLIASAYRLVEDVFRNDKCAFLQATYDKLVEVTEIVKFSESVKKNYGVLVFPEAYACLMPLVGRGKIAHGMSLVVDIGGGTTDISFFTIEEKEENSGIYHPQVYDFFSINKGLNYLTESTDSMHKDVIDMMRFFSADNIKMERVKVYYDEIYRICQHLTSNLKREYSKQTELYMHRLTDALKYRPIIYTGGGSTIKLLQKDYMGFCDQQLISYDSWKSKEFDDKELFADPRLCPVLSTAYGLSISVKNDVIVKKPFRDIFSEMRGLREEPVKSNFGGATESGFDYGLDYDAWK